MKQTKKITSKTPVNHKDYFNPYASSVKPVQRNTVKREKQRTYDSNHISGLRQEERIKKKSPQKSKQLTKKPTHEPVSIAKEKMKRTQPAKAIRPVSKGYTNPTMVKQSSTEQRRMEMRKKKAHLTQSQRIRLKKQRQMRAVIKIIFVMGLTIGIVWGGLEIKEGLKKPSISYQTVKQGTLDMSTLFEGVLLRNEKIIESQDEGYAKYLVADGEKVEKDGIVYALVDEGKLEASTTAKEEIESQIYNEADKKKSLSSNQDLRYSIDQGLKNAIETFYNNRYDMNINNVYSLRSKLESSIASRTTIYVAEQVISNQEAVAQRKELEKNIESYQKGKVTGQAGIISYHMDGFETENALSAIQTMDYAAYTKYRKAGGAVNLAPNEIKKGVPLYKLIVDNVWYIVTYIDTKEDKWVLNQTYPLNFDEISSGSVQCTLVSKKEEESRIQLVFKSSEQIDHLLANRYVTFTMGEKEVTGLKIPLEAKVQLNMIKIPKEYVVTENNQDGVYRQKGQAVEFVPINVQQKQEDAVYVIQDLEQVNGLKLNDILVKTDTNATYQVTESVVQEGVYVINNQMAQFVPIEILAQNSEYALVKYNNKSRLKEMDKIISNPKSIKNGQLLEEMNIQNE